MTQREINNILEELNNGKFHIECPSCYEEVNLKEACFSRGLSIVKRIVIVY